MTTEIEKYESGLAVEKHNALANRFNPFAEEMKGLLKQAAAIVVKDESDTKGMQAARETRLALRAIRVDIEKSRKEAKEAALREGKAVDGMANVLKYMIEPEEARLKELEDFVKLAEERRKAELSETRTAQLEAVEIDCSCFDLGNMSAEAYATLLASSKAGYEAKKAAEAAEIKRIEDERKAAEKAEAERRKQEAEERARIEAENAELRKKAEAAEKAAEAERKAAAAEQAKRDKAAEKERAKIEAERKKLEAELRKKAEAEQAERDRIAAEAKAAADAEKAKAAAPDKDKLIALDRDICALVMPSVVGDVALAAIAETRNHLNAIIGGLRKAVKDMEKGAK